MVRQALAGEDVTIFGDGTQTRSFCYVADLVRGLIALMELEGAQPGPVNLGNPSERTIRDLAERVLDLTNSASRIVHHPLPIDDPRRRRPDITKAGELLDWRPTTSIEEGLKATIAWFEAESRSRRPVAHGDDLDSRPEA
jgi:UDP-glucuronate decarboxylase